MDLGVWKTNKIICEKWIIATLIYFFANHKKLKREESCIIFTKKDIFKYEESIICGIIYFIYVLF